MRLKRDTIGSMLQGVSQQPPSRRVEGQNTLQLNMVSDASSGLRRRAGLKYMRTVETSSPVIDGKYFGGYISTKEGYRHLLINTDSGEYNVLDAGKVLQLREASVAFGTAPYLANGGSNSIQTTSVTGVTYILNTAATVIMGNDNEGKLNPKTTGFFYIVAGSYSTNYTVSVSFKSGEVHSFTYKTPDGSGDGHAAASTPEAIATKVAEGLGKLIGADKIFRTGCYVAFIIPNATDAVDISSGVSTSYIVTSNVSNVQVENFLAARLPKEADGLLCSIGASESAMSWYKYSDKHGAWIECGAWDSPSDTTDGTPLLMKEDGSLEHMTIEGRNAGNDENNEKPRFLKTGVISGIGTYAGRLVFLSDAYVCLSCAGKPKRFFRTTVSTNLGSDRVDIASGSAQSTTYKQAIQYNKDLIVIGDDAQAVIPFNSTKSSDNISLVVTSTVTCNSSVVPAQTLKTLLYPTRADTGYSSILELTPSSTSSSLYTTDDTTAHIPRYMKGNIRFMVCSPSWGLVAIGTEGDKRELIIHQYLFDGEGKVQNAWHRWEFDRDILWAYAGNDYIYILCKGAKDNQVVMFSIDPAQESVKNSVHLDYYMLVSAASDVGSVPEQLVNYARSGDLVCVYADGELAGSQVVIRYSDDYSTFTMERITGEPYTGRAILGVPFLSEIQPTSPLAMNQAGMAMVSSRARLLRFEVAANNSGEITAHVVDTATATDFSLNLPAVLVSSNDLEIGRPLVAESPIFQIPCRTKPATTQVSMKTKGIYDMHIISCDYIVKKE